MGGGATLVWFRNDLRLTDNLALRAAVQRGGLVIPVYLWGPAEEGNWAPGGASRWWLHQSLRSLDAALQRLGSRLVIRRGNAAEQLLRLARETGADMVHWNRRYEPDAVSRDRAVYETLRAAGVGARHQNASLLWEPWEIANREGNPCKVFTPYWRNCLAAPEPPVPEPAPTHLPAPETWPLSETLDALRLEPEIDWAAGFRATWEPGERGAARQLERFLDHALEGYQAGRDRPAQRATSQLAPHLHFGEIGPRQVWHAVRERCGGRVGWFGAPGVETFLRELGWREFAHHLLYHFPHTAETPLRPEFAAFPWLEDLETLRAWQKGRTGYPLVDAGMRELWATGWMHNRVRMVVASFLVKDLLLPWTEGARWFWDTLVDADLANNTLGWQWSAGCGADAAPYFRVFNPTAQAEKFDPDGEYVRRWVPELAELPGNCIHRPWDASPLLLKAAGVTLGETYPFPIVAHDAARQRALASLAQITRK